MIIVMAIVLVVVAAAWFWYFFVFSRGSNPTLPQKKLSMDGATWTVEMATTMTQQALGLSGRESLGQDDGMLFVFSSPGVQNFWMKDMNFSLDMIWISGDKVVGFAQNVPPPQPGVPLWKMQIYTSPYDVDKVLEVNAGTVAKYGIKVGDSLTMQ